MSGFFLFPLNVSHAVCLDLMSSCLWLHFKSVLRPTQRLNWVKFSLKCQINQDDVNLSEWVGEAQIKAAHKDKFINGKNFWNASVAEYFRQDLGASVGSLLHPQEQVSSLSLMETVHSFSSPIIRWQVHFPEPMLSGGGRALSQMQAVMHLRPIYCSDVLLTLWWRQSTPVCQAMVSLNTAQNYA